MMRSLAHVGVAGLAIVFCYGLQVSKPHYGDLIAPMPVHGKAGDVVETRTFDIGVDRVVFARTLKVDRFGATKELSTSGVWAVVTVNLAARQHSTAVTSAAWQGPTGLLYRTSERLSFAPGLQPFALDPGLPAKGRLVFEIRPDQASGATLLISEKLFSPLDSEARIALGDIALDPAGMPASTIASYDLGQTP